MLISKYLYVTALFILCSCNPPATVPEDEEATSSEDENETTSGDSDTDSETTTEEVEDSSTNQAGSLALGVAIQNVPQLTDPVLSYESTENSEKAQATARFDNLAIGVELALAGSTGLPFNSSASSLEQKFSVDGASQMFCDSMNLSMLAMANVVEADLNLCMMKKSLAGKTTEATSEYNFLDISIDEDGEKITNKYKYRLEQDEKGTVTLFEAFICEAIDGEAAEQVGYQKVTRENGKLKILSRNVGGPSGTLKLKVLLDADLNSENNIVGIKTIDYAETTGTSNDKRRVAGIIKQSSKNYEFNGFHSSGSRDVQFIAFHELIDPNVPGEEYLFNRVALGDGAAIFKESNNGSGGSPEIEGWDGDTQMVDPNSSRIAKVKNRSSELKEVVDPEDLELKSTEVWNCSSEEPVEVDLSETIMDECMDKFEITQDLSRMCSRGQPGGHYDGQDGGQEGQYDDQNGDQYDNQDGGQEGQYDDQNGDQYDNQDGGQGGSFEGG